MHTMYNNIVWSIIGCVIEGNVRVDTGTLLAFQAFGLSPEIKVK